MSTLAHRLPLFLLLGLAGAGFAVLGLTGWMRNAADIMLSLGAAGLSWCL
jgi:hypothetical protein